MTFPRSPSSRLLHFSYRTRETQSSDVRCKFVNSGINNKGEGKQVARIKFDLEMNQFAYVGLVFKELSIHSLRHPSFKTFNPYLKYAYSKYW